MDDVAPTPLPPSGIIPASRYRSQAFWALEWERVWTRVWLLAGHAARLPAPGDFFTFDVGTESILVTRGEDLRVRAFFNVCQHRGNLLCRAESGKVTSFQCPYHHFRYRLDGTLAHAPLADTFALPLLADVKLAEIPCETRLGFVWISMSPTPEPIDAFLAPVREGIAAYEPERFAPVSETTIEIACNWKTSVDVNNEAYHLRSLHPELIDHVDETRVREEILGRHSSIVIPLRKPLRDGALAEKRQFYVFPNVQLNFTGNTLEVYRHRPAGGDPVATLFDDQAYVVVPPGGAAPVRTARRIKHGEAPLGPVICADVDLLPFLTRGMASRGFAGLRLGAREACIANMHRVLDTYLFEEGTPEC